MDLADSAVGLAAQTDQEDRIGLEVDVESLGLEEGTSPEEVIRMASDTQMEGNLEEGGRQSVDSVAEDTGMETRVVDCISQGLVADFAVKENAGDSEIDCFVEVVQQGVVAVLADFALVELLRRVFWRRL